MKITAHAMLGVSRIWMEDDGLCGELAGHPLSSAARGELDVVHERLATALDQRRQMERYLSELTERITSAAARFARKGRALHNAFEVLADCTDDAAEAARYRQQKALFFPMGLRIFQRTHLEGIGTVEAVRSQVTPALMAELSAISCAGRTLADLYRAWAEAAHELGHYLHQRTRTREALRKRGSKAASVDVKAARAEWVRLVRMLLAIADMIDLSNSGRERLMGPLRRAVAGTAGTSSEADSQADQSAEEPNDEIIPDHDSVRPMSEPSVVREPLAASGPGSGSHGQPVSSVPASIALDSRLAGEDFAGDNREILFDGTKEDEVDTGRGVIWPIPAGRWREIN